MGLAVAIQMDPIHTINIDADSTFALALEAQARGHALFHYLPTGLTLRDGRLYTKGRKLEVFRQYGAHHKFGADEELDGPGVDVADRAGQRNRARMQPSSDLGGKVRGRALLDDLLVAPLDRAVALAEVDDGADVVADDLDFDVPGR